MYDIKYVDCRIGLCTNIMYTHCRPLFRRRGANRERHVHGTAYSDAEPTYGRAPAGAVDVSSKR